MSLFTRDLAERVVRTAVATFAGALVTTGQFDQSALITAGTAALTAVLSLIAKNFGSTDSASFMQ